MVIFDIYIYILHAALVIILWPRTVGLICVKSCMPVENVLLYMICL